MKASRGFPHGNFYTTWQVARTPGLCKTPNDDWKCVRSVLKTCWVANFGVCRKASSGGPKGGHKERERGRVFVGGWGAFNKPVGKVSNGTHWRRNHSWMFRQHLWVYLCAYMSPVWILDEMKKQFKSQWCSMLSEHSTSDPLALWEQVKLQLIVHKTQGAWQKHQLLVDIDGCKKQEIINIGYKSWCLFSMKFSNAQSGSAHE